MTVDSENPKEVLPIEELEDIANKALQASHKTHNDLGALGEELVQKNQFGDTVLKVDIEAEEAVIKVLKDAGLPIRIVSEEHGITEIGTNPQLLGILDGLDGSDQYKKGRGTARYGTMFGIFQGLEPKYEDYLYGGIMEQGANILYYGSRSRGSKKIENDIMDNIHTSSTTKLDKNSKLNADLYYDAKYGTHYVTSVTDKLVGYSTESVGSSAIHYANIASGLVDGVIECTRKGNLEIAVAYPLVTEAGGIMSDLYGQNLASKPYLSFGQNKHLVVVSACNHSFTKSLLEHLK